MAFILRNYPDDDALHHPEKYSKALSFCPDIIPQYGMNPDKDALTHPTSWRGFTGMPIVGGDVNNVFIRGHGSGGPYVASLRAFPSELILWPHVWHTVDSVASGPTVIHAGDSEGPCASDGPLKFRPPHCTGNTYSLVAHVAKHVPGEEAKPPQFDLEHFGVDDFVSFLNKDKEHTFYNVVVADPTLKHVTATTRLRMIGKSPVGLCFRITGHEGAPIPDGLEVSLTDDRGKIKVPRTELSSFKEHKVQLDPSYEGVLMLNIFSAGNTLFEPYSGFSLCAYKDEQLQSDLGLLLGALNIIFEPHSTRNLRFASPAAVQLRDAKDSPGEVETVSNTNGGCGPIAVTSPAATGWWTRAQMNDPNSFPHAGPYGYTPDIQPVGTDPHVQGILATLQNPSVDYSSAHNVQLFGNRKNYVYVRGHSTLTDIDVQCRLFVQGQNVTNYASTLVTDSVHCNVFGGGGTINQHCISGASANQFYVFEKPFEVELKQPGPDGNHYCFIVEFRHKRRCCPVYPAWPSDNKGDHATLADFQSYVLRCPLTGWRNINWQPCQPGTRRLDGWSWPCEISLVIPDCAHYSSFWSIIVECDNKVIPDGCKWSLACDDDKLFPNGVCFEERQISTQGPAIAGCHFAGARPGYRSKLKLSVTWCDGGDRKKYPPPCVKWKLAMTEPPTAPTKHLAHGPPEGHGDWPCYVTKDYPYIGDRPNPSPLPTFKSAGPNTWPFPDAVQHGLGAVCITAKPE